MTYVYFERRTPPQQQPASPLLGISALIAGSIGLLFSILPLLGIVLGAVGIILGAIAVVKKLGKGYGFSGIITGSVAVAVSGVLLLFF